MLHKTTSLYTVAISASSCSIDPVQILPTTAAVSVPRSRAKARFRSTPVAPPEPVASRARLRHAVPYPYDTYSGRGPGRHSAIVVYVHPAVRIACF